MSGVKGTQWIISLHASTTPSIQSTKQRTRLSHSGWYYIKYHVVFDFLEHVVIGHDEFLGCVAIGDVGQDAQRLKSALHQCCYLNKI